jgi:hypothetical protein
MLVGDSGYPKLARTGVFCHAGAFAPGVVEVATPTPYPSLTLNSSPAAAQKPAAGHETPSRFLVLTGSGALQEGTAAVGSLDVTARPDGSTTTHNDVVGQEMPDGMTLSICTGPLHLGVAAPGSVEITASPSVSTATHRELDAHETALRCSLNGTGRLSTSATFQVGVAAVGLVDVNACPSRSTATHNEVVGHEMSSIQLWVALSDIAVQLGVGAVGSVVIETAPFKLTATHRAVAAHEIAMGAIKPVSESLHVGAASVGSVEITACPLLSTATQRAVEEHEMSDRRGMELVSVPVASAGLDDIAATARIPASTVATPLARSRLARIPSGCLLEVRFTATQTRGGRSSCVRTLIEG